ncbi:Thiol-disulfide isomerase or thioredoxin [Mucilaginibacter lappiensis]|nr:Thiol-disulfide isomerase or thioredoxin [Mucilaginibacter lappiensis]
MLLLHNNQSLKPMKNLQNLFVVSLLLLVAFVSCKHDNSITIQGDIKGLNAKWVYLQSNYPIGSLPIDSAKVINGKFEFVRHPDTLFIADLVLLKYKDEKGKSNFLSVADPYKADKSKPSLYAAFIMEPGLTTLTGDLSNNKGISITAGHQNEFYFKNLDLPFIRISKDSVKRSAQAARIKKLVEDTPDAYWALFAFNDFKYDLNHQQIKSIFDEFNDEVKSSYQGKNIKQFLDDQPKNKNEFPNSVFADQNAKPVTLVDTTRKLNMVVFWASWCGPCQREIPSLKKIAFACKNDNLRFVSVSIDDQKTEWIKAVNEENMPWQQLIIPAKQVNRANAQYNLGWVPQIYLVNNKRQIVKKIDGFDAGNEEIVKTFITNYLAKN